MSHKEELTTAVIDGLTLDDGILFHDRRGRARDLRRAQVPLADTHGHLTCFRGHDPAMAICRAALAGVRLLVVPVDPVDEIPRRFSTPRVFLDWLDEQVEKAAEKIELLARAGLVPPAFGGDVPDLVDNVHIVAGAHPYGAAELGPEACRRLDELLASPRCVGVGEIGLDFGPYNELPAGVQEAALRRQLRVAHEHDLPVELHVRDGADDATHAAHALVARVLAEEGAGKAGCDLHCFTQGPEVLAPFVELGCHIAFGGAVTFSRSDDVRAAAVACPADLILSETDSPYMAPVPLRGEECEPAMVALTVDRLADVRAAAAVGCQRETREALWTNARQLFGV